MIGVVIVLAITLLVLASVLAAMEIDRATRRRRARREALQRTIIVQAADQRMRQASRAAMSSMLAAVDNRFTRGPGR